MTAPSNPAEIRQLAGQVLARARNERAYLHDLQSDPVATLQAAGFSLECAREFSQELGNATEVAGYMPRQTYCEFTCDAITCILTYCGNWMYTN